MWLIALLGCYERVVMDVRVDAGRRTIEVLSQQQGLDQDVGGTRCEAAADCLQALRDQLAEERQQLGDAGATDIRNGVFLRDGELDLVTRYSAPYTSSLFAGGAPVQVVQRERRGAQRPVAIVFDAPDGAGERSTISFTGPHTSYDLGELGRMTTLPRGRPRVHIEHQLRSDGADVVVEPWVASVPGLVEAIGGSGLLLDPAGLVP